MILDYAMLRDLGEHHRSRVAAAYAAGGIHISDKPQRRRWWSRQSSHGTDTGPSASPRSVHATARPTTQHLRPKSATESR